MHPCPYGLPGDRLWVRETFVQGFEYDAATDRLQQFDDEGNELAKKTWYRATDSGITWTDDDGWAANVPWRPSIHMPRSACRLELEVVGVRVERLQCISADDLAAEGIQEWIDGGIDHDGLPRDAFRSLWESINGRGSWDANPWIWVIEFRRTDGGT